VNKAKTLKMKFLYVIAALAMLAMLIPVMAVPVSAAPTETLTMTVNGVADGTAGRAFNISGSVVTVTASAIPTSWELSNITVDPNGSAPAAWVVTPVNGTDQSVQVRGIWGEANITAHFADGDVSVNKKWGMLDHTSISGPGTTYVTWNETSKSWFDDGSVTDTVYGNFIENSTYTVKVAQGTILNFYLVAGDALVSEAMAKDYGPNLKTYVNGLADAQYVQFVDPTLSANWGYDQWHHTTNGTNGWLGTGPIQKISGVDGTASVTIGAWFEENVKIVVVPEYPNNPNIKVGVEVTSYNFGTRELEVVPQVRWAGEKIVLEANYGIGTAGYNVTFSVHPEGVGILEPIGDDDGLAATVFTTVAADGIASVILKSNTSGQADVTAALKEIPNQQDFRVYFLNFESLTLGDVDGKRAQHNAGLWGEPENPFNNNFPEGVSDTDMLDQTLNVSQDALERAQIRGWFVPPPSAQKSTRPEAYIDIDGDLESDDLDDVLAPAGRWILPDDWARLAGKTNWQENSLFWDIMDSPNPDEDHIAAITSPLGDFKTAYGSGTLVAPANTIGPFAPGIEIMTPSGWMVSNPTADTYTIPGSQPPVYPRAINTVVPNGLLDAWDAPMPPAKIIFEIMSGAGYFKDAMKKDIYYETIVNPGSPATTSIVYTSPFYQELIPAHESIPPFNNQSGGGYDWNSFDGVHGPYEFWKIINQPDMNAITHGDALHPTKVEVYSDNHGEAMVYLNGDWNLDLSSWKGDTGYDVEPGAIIASSTVQASAKYPYTRLDQVIFSNTVEKEWFWSGQILGTEPATYPAQSGIGATDPGWTRMVLATGVFTHKTGTFPDETGMSDKRMVWVWVTDRDGKMAGALGSKVDWYLMSTTSGVNIPDISGTGISNYNATTQAIVLQNGFLAGTKRLTNPMDPTSYINSTATIGHAVTRAPEPAEKDLFTKFYGSYMAPGTSFNLSADNFSVAAIEIQGGATAEVDVVANITTPSEGLMIRHINLDFSNEEKCDDPLQYGDANADGTVNMADVVTVERIILGLASRTAAANASWDINPDGSYNIDMGDVVRIEKIILTGN